MALSACGIGSAEPDGPRYNVGYRFSEFSYHNSAEQEVTRNFCIWYPTRGKAEVPIDYKGAATGRAKAEEAQVADGEHPVILFSHGLWSAPEFSSFIHEHLARQGYIVAGPHHKDAVTEWKNHRPTLPEFFKPHEWDDKRHYDRGEDISALLDHLTLEHGRNGSFLKGHFDTDAVAIMGHSMGGYTAFGLIGGWPSWHDRRVKCALMLSPYIHPFLRKGGAEDIKIPVMFQGAWPGDLGITPFLPPLYEKLPKPKYLLVLEGENHFSWTNLVCKGKPEHEAVREGSAELIVRYGTAFFDRYVREEKSADEVLREKDKALNEYVLEDPERSLK